MSLGRKSGMRKGKAKPSKQPKAAKDPKTLLLTWGLHERCANDGVMPGSGGMPNKQGAAPSRPAVEHNAPPDEAPGLAPSKSKVQRASTKGSKGRVASAPRPPANLQLAIVPMVCALHQAQGSLLDGGCSDGIEQTPNKFAVLASPAAALLAPIRVAKTAAKSAKRRAAKRDAVTPTAADDDESGYLGSAEAERDAKAMADCDAFYEYMLAAPRPPAYGDYSSAYPGMLGMLDVAGARAIDGAAATAAALVAPVPVYGGVPRGVGLPLHAAAALKLALPRAARPALDACIDGALAAWFSGCAVIENAIAVYPRWYSIVDSVLP